MTISLVVGLAIRVIQANPLPGPVGESELRAPPQELGNIVSHVVSCYY